MIEIKNRFRDVVTYASEKANIKEAVEEAVALKINLSGSNLSCSNLRDSNLSGSNLSGSNLRGSNLRGSILSGSDLSGSDLSGCDLRGCDLRDCDLSGSHLSSFKNDIFEILLNAPAEVATLKTKLIAGEIDGSCYEPECGMACLCGTIAIARGCGYAELPGIKPDSSRPAEQWFFNIHPGCTPDTNAVAAITLDWIEEFEQKLAQAITTMENAHKCI